MNKSFQRFLKYCLVGGSTFAFDLFLLFLLVDHFEINSTFSAGISFVIAVSVNYFLSRKFVFQGTLRSIKSGYFIFLGIALFGMLAIIIFMFIFVEILHWHYLVSRIIIASLVGSWNYLMNLYVNFKVANHTSGTKTKSR